jgi:geranylgeranylglycerol-phosphate geranylgeranyltransferase
MIARLRLLRPGNLLILGGAILFARALAGGGGEPRAVYLSTAASMLLVASFYIWNDCADREVDRVNRPERPIPSGAVSVRSAALAAALLLVGAFAAAGAAGGRAPLVLGTWTLLLALYETLLKRRGLAGNVLVSAVASSALLFGAHLGGSLEAGIAPALFAFLLHLGREIVKDIADAPGDREGARRTLPIALGDRRALVVSVVPLALLVLLSPVPFFLGIFDVFYMAVVFVGVDLLLAYGLARCFRRPDRANLGRLSLLLKGQMLLGMTAMLLGRSA